MITDPTTITARSSAASVGRSRSSECPFDVSSISQPYRLNEILEMQFTVAQFGKGGLAQEYQASDQMEIQEFLWIRDKVVKITNSGSGSDPEDMMRAMGNG